MVKFKLDAFRANQKVTFGKNFCFRVENNTCQFYQWSESVEGE
jgi:hypothetical protein